MKKKWQKKRVKELEASLEEEKEKNVVLITKLNDLCWSHDDLRERIKLKDKRICELTAAYNQARARGRALFDQLTKKGLTASQKKRILAQLEVEDYGDL